MSHVLTETDSFDATITVPDPGDNRTAASVNAEAQAAANRARYLYNRSRSRIIDVTRAPYSAVGDGTADDTTAIQNALNDAASGYDVFLPGTHRITAALVVPPAVNILGVPGRSSLLIDHATARTLSYSTGTYDQQASVLYGITFSALQANSGAQVYNPAGTSARLNIEHCNFSASAFCQGLAIDFAGASSLVSLQDCYFTPRLGHGVISSVGGFSALSLRGCHFIVQAIAYANTIVFAAGTNAQNYLADNFFDMTNVTAGGGPVAVSATQGFTTALGNRFKGSIAAICEAFSYGTGNAVLRERGNIFTTCTAYDASSVFADGSALDITKHERHTGVGTTFTWPDDVETLELEGSSTVPTITLPNKLLNGRKIRLLIKNLSGSSWGAITLSGAVFLSNTPALNLANGEAGLIDLEVATVVAPNTPAWTVTKRGP